MSCYLKRSNESPKQLANPHIAPHLQFSPETDERVVVNCFSQCKKWREDLPPELRAPMTVVHGKHYYIYEPAQLLDLSTVVPCFFYVDGGVMMAKALQLITKKRIGSDKRVLKLISEPAFDSTTFLSITVSEFFAPYPDITTRDGRKLSDHCDSVLWSEDISAGVPLTQKLTYTSPGLFSG